MQKYNQWYLTDNETSERFKQYANTSPLYGKSWQNGIVQYVIHNFVPPNSRITCIDIGASYGFFTTAVAQYFKTVHAVEMQTDVFECLKINTNWLDNVHCYNYALGSHSGYACWDINVILGTGHARPIESNSGVPIITLDSMNLSADLLKIDVEGYELEVLKGSVETLTKYNPTILVEIHNSTLISPKPRLEVFNFLHKLNYKCVDCRECDFVFIKDGI